MHLAPATLLALVEQLRERDWALSQDALPSAWVADWVAEIQSLVAAGQFSRPGIGHGRHEAVTQDLRGDLILPLRADQPPPAAARYFQVLAELRNSINQRLFWELSGIEAHYSLYLPGAGYRKHLDCLTQHHARGLSCLLYLNPNWQPADGGLLRLYHPEGYHEIAPTAGNWLIFRSDRIYHEVLPAQAPRLSLAAWLHRPRPRLGLD